MKLGIIAEEDIFRKTTEEFFTEYYKSLKVLLEAQKGVDV
ncbi:hypothetical protein TOPH_06897 [Tolypocladium ophioglossoides CBS 100239]|uniref:Uncharacterized protein n=1 Tax=Tolypocladium ophioglossoides (strain CBS 100239) TaxID=1163406 RepID=A0A0L0N3G5_TOLOC|nr:hypothetical protein TOPH_06897 [Tolypocladium ophioglossoides CBS 100239]